MAITHGPAHPSELEQLVDEHKALLLCGSALVLVAVSILLNHLTHEDPHLFPHEIADKFAFAQWVNQFEDWLKENYRWLTRSIAHGVGWALEYVETFMILAPWPVVMAAIALPALKFGGLRLALFCLIAMLFWGVMDMWDSSMETLSLMAVAVAIAVVLGVALGILASQSNAVEAVVKPVLDTMQTMPSFVYLIPAIFFFGIGGPPAVLATVVYALPPAVRLTNLGIRQVSGETLEAARSFGTTPLQMLVKVKLPLAAPSIMMGINQTIMMALGMVVIATFIGARGLGYEVWQALRHLNVGWSLEGGLSIVFMAIMFDRISYAMSGQDKKGVTPLPGDFRLLPRRLERHAWARAMERGIDTAYAVLGALADWLAARVAAAAAGLTRLLSAGLAEDVRDFVRRRGFLVASLALLVVLYYAGQRVELMGSFPSGLTLSFREPVDDAVKWLTVNEAFIAVTTWIRVSVFLYLLDPLAEFLAALPWWYAMLLVSIVVWVTAGRSLALLCFSAMLFIGAVDLWQVSMFTLASILVSVLLCFLIGVPIGILAANSRPFEAFLKPILDAMQTMPAFVYLIPVLMFFGGNVVSAVIATLVYAIPPMIRLTTLGIREVPYPAVEASHSFGSTSWQTLWKVRLPLALPSIMMGLNQAVMMALAMQILTPLIGGGGLGQEVFNALAAADTGAGLEAGLSIVFLAIVMDRLTQAWSRKQREALGIQ